MTDLAVPDACSLTPTDFGERIAWIRQEILPHATGREPLADGVAWRFGDDSDLRAKLLRLVDLESDCCAGDQIRFSLRDEPGGGLRLEVHGIDPATSLLGGLPTQQTGRLRRLLQAGGVGTLGALLLCCLLPIGVAVLAGAAVAAPLAALERPLPIAAVALLVGAGTWWALRRREQRRGC